MLPVGCIVEVVARTTPRDACRAAAVSSTFRSAVEHDAVWERFLPADCDSLLCRSGQQAGLAGLSKRDLFFRLCDRPLVLDAGKSGFWLERCKGAKCYVIPATQISLPWDDGPHCWKWTPHARSRFGQVAELVDITWLEIYCTIPCKLLTPRTNYAAYLTYDTLPDGSFCGLSYPDQETSITVGGRCVAKHKVCLLPNTTALRNYKGFHRDFGCPTHADDNYSGDMMNIVPSCPRPRKDGWMEIEMGEFFVGEESDVAVQMSFEILGGYRKSGLLLEGIEVRPPSKCK